MAGNHVEKTGTQCLKNSRLLGLPEDALRRVLCFLDEDSSGELDQNPLISLRVVCKDLKHVVDDNLTWLACFTRVPSDSDETADTAAWVARVRQQIRDVLPKWRELRHLRWHFHLPLFYFKHLLAAVATSRPDLQELTLLPDHRYMPSPGPGIELDGWKAPSYLNPLTSFHGLQTLTIKDLLAFCYPQSELTLPALPSLQVLRIEDPCAVVLGALPALRELQVSWSHHPGGHCEMEMPHLALSTRLARVSLPIVELDHSLQFPDSLESLQLNRTVMQAHGSLHLGKQLVHLTELDLNRVGEYVPVDDQSFSVLMRLATKLRSLKLDCASFRSLPDLSAQTSLTSLTLTGVHTKYNMWASTIPFPTLAPLRSLRQLEVAKFADKMSLDLQGLTALERLSLDDCEQLTALQGLEDLSRLQILTLKDMTVLEVKLDPLVALETLVLGNMLAESGWSLPSCLKRLEFSHYYSSFASEHVQKMFSLPSDVEVVVKPPPPFSF